MTGLQSILLQALANQLANELDVHYAVMKCCDNGSIEWYTGGMHKVRIGYWCVVFKGNQPHVTDWVRDLSPLSEGHTASNKVIAQMMTEGVK
jgi:hypothetical protein